MGDIEIQDEKESSPLGVGEGDMEQAEYEEGSSGGAEEEEEEEEGPPPRPGRRVTFEERDKLAVEFQERDMYQHSELVYTCRPCKVSGGNFRHRGKSGRGELHKPRNDRWCENTRKICYSFSR